MRRAERQEHGKGTFPRSGREPVDGELGREFRLVTIADDPLAVAEKIIGMEVIEVEIIGSPIAVEAETGRAGWNEAVFRQILALRLIGPKMPFPDIGGVISRPRQNMADAIM